MIIQKLLLLESEAQNAIRMLEKEQTLLSTKAEADLLQQMAAIEEEQDNILQKCTQDTAHHTATAIAKIQADYEQKGRELILAFTANHHMWKEKILHEVIHV